MNLKKQERIVFFNDSEIEEFKKKKFTSVHYLKRKENPFKATEKENEECGGLLEDFLNLGDVYVLGQMFIQIHSNQLQRNLVEIDKDGRIKIDDNRGKHFKNKSIDIKEILKTIWLNMNQTDRESICTEAGKIKENTFYKYILNNKEKFDAQDLGQKHGFKKKAIIRAIKEMKDFFKD